MDIEVVDHKVGGGCGPLWGMELLVRGMQQVKLISILVLSVIKPKLHLFIYFFIKTAILYWLQFFDQILA